MRDAIVTNYNHFHKRQAWAVFICTYAAGELRQTRFLR